MTTACNEMFSNNTHGAKLSLTIDVGTVLALMNVKVNSDSRNVVKSNDRVKEGPN